MLDDAWFAGFSDGEACFDIRRCENGTRHHPRFGIGLRSDDALILERLQAAFGGRLHYSGRKDAPWGNVGGIAPQCRWHVVAKADLVKLVEYFDRFPLRAKKARDYAVWRRAVMVYCAAGGRDPRLAALCDAIRSGRVFDADEPEVPDAVPEEWQLRLGC